MHEVAKKAATEFPHASSIYHFRHGTLLTDLNAESAVGDEFCSLILVLQMPKDETGAFQNQPIEGWGPDSLHCEVASADVRLIPQHPDYLGELDIRFADTEPGSKSHVFAAYTVAYALNHPGSYVFTAEVEFQNYDWVLEDPVDLVNNEHPYAMIDAPVPSRSPPMHVAGVPISRPTQQCYRDGFNDVHGRWYLASSFDSKGSQTALNPATELAFANIDATIDEFGANGGKGWTFAPDACSLSYFGRHDFQTCLADRGMQFLGESNSRRLLKSLISGGNWCTDASDEICQCHDQWQGQLLDMNAVPLDITPLHETTLRSDPTTFGSNSKVYFDFVGGLLNQKLFNPWFYFYDPTSDIDDSTIISRRSAEHGNVDLVHVSFNSWDVAGVRTADQVLASLPDFRRTLLSAYPPGTRFITRLANGICCGNQDRRNRFSAPRFAIWNEMWRQFWANDEAAGAMLVYDASVLQGRRDAETAFFCPTTHLRGSFVRLETQLWLNAVCDSNVNGAVMRRWGYTDEVVEEAKVALASSPKGH